MNTVKELANAKINLYLDVVGRREDGFHDIKTVMHSVSLSDVLRISLVSHSTRSVRLSLVCDGVHLPTDSKNLAVSAAELFLSRASINASVNIELVKNIPIAAGLAGGSSDAAAVLRGMNRLFGRVFTTDMLLKLALEIGSDVPYCLLGKTALCEGRGEIITKLPEPNPLHLVIAIGDERVSTPTAYKALDVMYSNFTKPRDEGRYLRFASALQKGSLSGSYNIFEDVVLSECKKAEYLKERFLSLGAVSSLMSGSGPSVFGVFSDESSAKGVESLLRDEGFRAYYAVSV